MRRLTKNNTLLISFLLLTLLTTSDVFAQKEVVNRDFINRGKDNYKSYLRKANKPTEQITIDYKTLRDIVDQADTSSPITFIIVGIDKKQSGDTTIWTRLNNNLPIADLDKKQGLIIRYIVPALANADPKALPMTIYAALGKLCPPPVCPEY